MKEKMFKKVMAIICVIAMVVATTACTAFAEEAAANTEEAAVMEELEANLEAFVKEAIANMEETVDEEKTTESTASAETNEGLEELSNLPEIEWTDSTTVTFTDGTKRYEICLNAEDKLVLYRVKEDGRLDYPLSETEKEFLGENLYYFFYYLVENANMDSARKTLEDEEIDFEWTKEMMFSFTNENVAYEISLDDESKLTLYGVTGESKKEIYVFNNKEEVNYLNYYVVDNYFVYIAELFGL